MGSFGLVLRTSLAAKSIDMIGHRHPAYEMLEPDHVFRGEQVVELRSASPVVSAHPDFLGSGRIVELEEEHEPVKRASGNG